MASKTNEPKRPNVTRPIGNTDAATSGVSGAKTTSSQSSSDLGVPGDYPRDPRIALDNLSDKSENVTEDSDGLIDSAASDLRHAFGVASQYLQDSVTGAVNTVFPSEPTVTAVGKGIPGSRFKKEDLAVAGIASNFTPSSSKSRFSTTGAENSPSITPRNSRFNSKDLAIGGIASDFTPSSSKFIYSDDGHRRANKQAEPATEAEETPRRGRSAKPAFTSYAPGPIVNDSKPSRGMDDVPTKTDVWDGTVPSNSSKNTFGASTSVPASKEKKDNDVEEETATFAPKTKDSDRSTDLRKRAMGTAATGAGIGAASGAAYKHSRLESRPSSNDNRSEMGAVDEQQPAFVSYAPAPVITDTDDAPTTSINDVSGNYGKAAKPDPEKGAAGLNDLTRSESYGHPSERKKVVETIALGAGIGTVGGATYAHSGSASGHAQYTGASQPECVDKSNRAASTSDAKATSSKRDSDEAQPAFAAYAPAPVITGDEKRLSRDDIEKNAKPTSAVRDEGYHSEGDKQVSGKDSGGDTRMKQVLGAGAIGAGALGGAAYASSRGRGQDFSQETPKGVTSDPGTNLGPDTQTSATTSHPHPLSKATSSAPGDEVQSGGAAGVAAAQPSKSTGEGQAKREKEMAKREEKVKQHETAVAAAKKKARNEEKVAEKEHEKREKEMREREKEMKKREEATTPAAVAKDRKVKGTEALNEGAEDGGDKDAKKKNAAAGVVGAAGGASLGAGLANASTDESKKRSSTSSFYSEHFQTQQPSAESKEPVPAHPSVKAASAPPQRPGPIALGAAGPNDKAKSGADSDFPLPAENVNDGSETNSPTTSGKHPGSAAGADAKEGGTAAGTEPYRPRSRYHGTEGVQEKQEGGVLRSSTIENMKNGSLKESNAGENPSGRGNGNGKGNGGRKEGFVKHIVEKVKDRLHHHEK